MKTCTKCGVPKRLGNFYSSRTTRDGLMGWCKECFTARSEAARKDRIAGRKRDRSSGPTLPGKRCSRCGGPGPFHGDKCTADGLSFQCKSCRNRVYHDRYRAAKSPPPVLMDGITDRDEIQRRIAKVRELKRWVDEVGGSLWLSTIDAVLS